MEVFCDGHWGTVCDDQWEINNFFISDVICKTPNYSPPNSLPPDTQSSRKCWLVLLFFQICSWETSVGSFNRGNNLKQRLKLKSFETCSSFGVNGALDLCDSWPLALTGHITNASFKQWVRILPKIDRVVKNYLTPKIWDETHLRETFMALWYFNKVVWFVLAAMLEGILLPSNMAAKTTFSLYLVKHLLICFITDIIWDFIPLLTAANYFNMTVSNKKALATLDTVHKWT